MMTVDKWLARIRLGEDTTLELERAVMHSEAKVDGPHPGSLAIELAAMGNAQGGTLILGVDDKTRQVLGIAYATLDTVEKWLAKICQTRIQSPLDFPVREDGLGREFLMHRRGSGVDVIMAESERLSGKKPVYENIADMELRLTIYAAEMPNVEGTA